MTFCMAATRTARRLGEGRIWHVGDAVQSTAGLETACMAATLENEQEKIISCQGACLRDGVHP